MDQDAGFGREGAGGSGADGAGAPDGVLRALTTIRGAVGELSEALLWSRSDACSRDGVREGFAVLQSLESAWLGLVADLDSRPEAVPGARAGCVAATFLRAGLLRTAGQAASDVRAAHALAADADPGKGGMPLMGAAFAAGQVSREHVDVALKAVRKIPKTVLSAPLPTSEDPEPENPGPGAPEPDSADSGSSEPGTAEPGTAEPASADPGSSEPGTGEPDSADSGGSEQDTAEPGMTEPGTAEPDPADPSSSKPGTTKPDTAEADSTDSGSSEPGTTEPGTAEPDSADPGSSERGGTEPDGADPGSACQRRAKTDPVASCES